MATRFARYRPWIPVLVWLGILALESSDFGSSDRTGHILRWLWTKILGTPNEDTFELVHHLIRKTGHFTGYAILSWLIFRALRMGWRNRQQIVVKAREYYWQFHWALLGIVGTLAAGSLDEFHQSFNPDRTGRWPDVVIDCSGALAFQILIYLWTTSRGRRPRTEEANAQA